MTKIIPPADGWKLETFYLVEVSYTKTNPRHKAIFYSGYLNKENYPSQYNQINHPSYITPYQIQDVYFMEVIRKLDINLKRTVDDKH